MTSRDLSESEIAYLANLIRSGESINKAAKCLGRSNSACQTWAKKLGLLTAKAHRPWTTGDNLLAGQYLAQGLTGPEIAKRIMRSPKAVEIWMLRHGGKDALIQAARTRGPIDSALKPSIEPPTQRIRQPLWERWHAAVYGG